MTDPISLPTSDTPARTRDRLARANAWLDCHPRADRALLIGLVVAYLVTVSLLIVLDR